MFDNADRVRAIRGNLARNAVVVPCVVQMAGVVESTPSSPPPDPTCELTQASSAGAFELLASAGSSPFREVSVSGARDGCSATVRADSAAEGNLALAWFPTGERCSPLVKVQLERKLSVEAHGFVRSGESIGAIGGQETLAQVRFPVLSDRRVAVEFDASSELDDELELWSSKRRVQSLALVAATPTVFSHRVGFDAIESSCEAARGSRVAISGGDGTIMLTRVGLGRVGVDVSFNLEGSWKIDTGACVLSNRRLEITAFVVLLAAQLIALGYFAWFTERRWF